MQIIGSVPIATIVLQGVTLLVESRVIIGVVAGVFSASAYAMAAYLRQKLYLAIHKCNTDEITKASQKCDAEIVKIPRKNLNIEVENEK